MFISSRDARKENIWFETNDQSIGYTLKRGWRDRKAPEKSLHYDVCLLCFEGHKKYILIKTTDYKIILR